MKSTFRNITPLIILILLFFSGCTKEIPYDPGAYSTYVSINSPAENQSLSADASLVIVKIDEQSVVTKMELYLDDFTTPINTLTAAPWIFELKLSELNEGKHTLNVKAYLASGAVLTDTRIFLKTKSSVVRDERMLLVENFTNTGCIPCKAAEEAYERIIGNEALGSRVATILYHVFWPDPKDPFFLANKPPVQLRVQYDSVQSAPHVRLNGYLRANNTLDYFTDWQAQMLDELNRPPDIGIKLSKEVNGDSVSITASISPYTQTFPSDLKYYLVIAEDSVYYEGSNGIKIHNFAMRDMITGGLGESITITKDQPFAIRKQFVLKPNWVRKHLHAVAFVQSHASRLALQAAKIKIE